MKKNYLIYVFAAVAALAIAGALFLILSSREGSSGRVSVPTEQELVDAYVSYYGSLINPFVKEFSCVGTEQPAVVTCAVIRATGVATETRLMKTGDGWQILSD